MKKSTLIIFSLAILGNFAACKHDIPQPSFILNNGGGNGGGNGNGSLAPCDSDSVYFEQQVLPILVSNCTMSGCHNSTTHAEGIDLTSYAAVMNSEVVNPGHAGTSSIMHSINTWDPGDVMPPAPTNHLLAAQITLIRNWINQGALDLHCDAGCDTTVVTYSGSIASIMTNYCNGCHGGANPSANIDLTNYAGVSSSAADGSLYGSVIHDPTWSAMPKNSAMLPQCKIDQLRIWVNAGAPNN